MLTVSSKLQNPISFPGRLLDIVMEIYAITVIGSLAGALGAFLIKRDKELDAAAEPNSPRRPRKAKANASPPANRQLGTYSTSPKQ